MVIFLSCSIDIAYEIKRCGGQSIKCPRNNQMTSLRVQKELVNVYAAEITRVIIDDIGDDYFSLMIDEA